ncbi:MAG: xanthine dehydrogenase family protein subunit M [Chloroflexi bacterium]|nr:xanthine dehydrogenase family protein subunit M [Chloroflexota bacterium]
MVTNNFEYFAPESFDEAAQLLAKYRDTAKILAGGQSLLPIMKLRLAAPEVLIDLSHVPELSEISSNGDGLTIGSMATYYELSQSAVVQKAAPAIAEAAGQVADVQVRNRGTIGGSLSHSDPAGDMPAVFLALNGAAVARTRRGTREIASDRFFVDLLTTALRPTEIMTQIKIPVATGKTGSAYSKFENKASHYAIAGVAAQVTLGSDGTVTAARVAVTGVSSKSTRAKRTERILIGKEPTASVIRRASDRAAAELQDDLTEDIHASGEYRSYLATVIAERAITAAVERAR